MNVPLKGISKKFKGVSYGPSLRPERDWLVLIAAGIMLFVASVIWNLWLFDKVTNGEVIGNETLPVKERRVNLHAVNALFEQRAQEEARYLSEYRFVDPSSVGR